MAFLGDRARSIGCASTLLVAGCGPQPGSGDGGGTESGDHTSGLDAGDDEAPQPESTGAEPMPPECAAVVCGDGIVGLDEPCDDANADDADGCTAQCQRNEPTPIATLERSAQAAAFDTDGSVLVVESGDDPRLVRLAPDGTEIWGATLAYIHAVALLVGPEIVVVGNRSVDDAWEGSTWRFAPDGTPNGRVDDSEGRYYVDADLAENGDTVVLLGSLQTFGSSVERRTADGSRVWIQEDIGDGTLALMSIALATDDGVLAVGSDVSLRDPIVAWVTADEWSTFASADYPDMYFYEVAADGAGGAIAAGDASGQLVLASIVPPGNPASVWLSTCSVTGAAVRGIVVSDDRIRVHGERALPEPDCGDVCSGAHASWVQHFALDGTVVAQDVAESLDPEQPYPYETALAVRRDDAGGIVAFASGQAATSYLARFPE